MSFSDSFFGGESVAKHQIGGNPLILQNAGMEIFCQLGSHGYSTRTVSPETEQKLTENCGEWVLLCQIDHDEDCGMNWEDDGRLYFWIKKTDLQACNFDNVWTILQCF